MCRYWPSLSPFHVSLFISACLLLSHFCSLDCLPPFLQWPLLAFHLILFSHGRCVIPAPLHFCSGLLIFQFLSWVWSITVALFLFLLFLTVFILSFLSFSVLCFCTSPNSWAYLIQLEVFCYSFFFSLCLVFFLGGGTVFWSVLFAFSVFIVCMENIKFFIAFFGLISW